MLVRPLARLSATYYYSALGGSSMLAVVGGVLRRPKLMLRLMRATDDPLAAAPFAEPHRRAYEEELAPRHRAFAAELPRDDAAAETAVAPTTAPAWTPLFARAVAVVTDGGSVVAHASLVAREYGIPAVVGTVNATERLHDGQLVMVDGTLGRVELLEAR